jgi:hypothetical protein
MPLEYLTHRRASAALAIITAFFTAALGEPDGRGIGNHPAYDWWNANLLGLG